MLSNVLRSVPGRLGRVAIGLVLIWAAMFLTWIPGMIVLTIGVISTFTPLVGVCPLAALLDGATDPQPLSPAVVH